ncbi:hypothetical protein [Xanthobacter sp. 91]|uniref:hypothetical protein n=1 Tax=Xanthobacter sp. 91 TaxID=1117244 RepID=UPI000495A59A|nr:hypothetical protein [Xanthobacter sp. 91]
MADPVTIGLMALAFLVGYAIGRIEAVGDMEKQFKAGYLAGERATRAEIIRAARPEGGAHG